MLAAVFADLRKFENGRVIETDLCVIGAGAAGISIARALSNTSLNLCLVESGGLTPHAATQALYQGPVVNPASFPLDEVRKRQFGGSTALWGAQCRPLDEIDFETRDWVPHSGWPFGLDALAPYFPEAQDLCGLGPYDYDVHTWRSFGVDPILFDPAKLENRLWQIGSSPVRFGDRYRADLKHANNVRVLLHANAVELGVNAASTHIETLRLKTLDGREAQIRARAFVLACGGIENPRLLLASNKVASRGIGNQNDLVGRFFMDHPHAPLAVAKPRGGLDMFSVYHKGVPHREIQLRLKVGLPPAVQRRERLLNTCLILSVGVAGDRGPGFLAAKRLVRAMVFRARPESPWEDLKTVIGDLGGLAGGVARRLSDPKVLWLTLTGEQAPNPDSRVVLDRERDALGVPRALLDWRLTDLEKRTARYLCASVGKELDRLGIAEMEMQDWLAADDNDWPVLEGQYHHIGTTRMHENPKMGVVDGDGKVHGLDNLYVAGSSTFPTGGYANPTVTIVALALRLADHLRSRLA